ncbi:AlpA family transcriptional regulator [Variovorax sp. WS11]|uniref:helix-turn-helix transcriptional regulator n=1 Tax=Variovorax sp. WS11 TaxID=1105204 RepID=UPI000D0D355E|nr:AlpA family phage regulatory protein [Variovorax sp. WS11]NDZ12703.1 AlpA family phage regulatory protein [Variovorax sp. WS11]PSL84647.1 AlpA family transcriptional regulator [Variovorax sp. WS11]
MASTFHLIRRPAVIALTGWSRSTLFNRIKAGEFPAPVPTGPRTVAWVETEVAAYLAARVKERDARLQHPAAKTLVEGR